MRTQLRFWMTAAIAVSAMATNGCSSTEKTQDPGPTYKYPDAPAFCAGVAKAICTDKFVAACAGSKDNCPVKLQADTCKVINTGTYRPAVAEDCVKAYETAYDDGQLSGTEQAAITAACTIVFGGNGGTGAQCTKLTDCDLDAKLQCVKGKCEVPDEVAAGEDCSADDKTCEKGYYCTAADKICAKAPVAGGACSASKPCAEEFLCVIASGGTEGLCQSKIADGEACTAGADSDCASKLCVPGPGKDAGTLDYTCGSVHIYSPFDPYCQLSK
ncbi:MAG: hypothetical protein HY898_30540 [Deltaproteobacteria bacterium]|nr:hypothetical protein [Deltaproteobacteria bacterium]